MARISIELPERTVENLREFCKLNNTKVNTYLRDIIEKQLNIDRFGDLNQKIKKAKTLKINEVKMVTEAEDYEKNEKEIKENTLEVNKTEHKKLEKTKAEENNNATPSEQPVIRKRRILVSR